MQNLISSTTEHSKRGRAPGFSPTDVEMWILLLKAHLKREDGADKALGIARAPSLEALLQASHKYHMIKHENNPGVKVRTGARARESMRT